MFGRLGGFSCRAGAPGPGRVLDRAVPLAEVPDGCRALDDRSAPNARITF